MEAGTVRALPLVADVGVRRAEARRELPGTLESAAEARRVVRQALRDADRLELVDAAELAVSEVVSNATLHAHTPVELWVGVGEAAVWVEVRDFNPTLPVQREYEAQATTGRGMGLVSAVASACGVHSLGDDGKVVWFCVSDEAPALDPAELLTAWDIDELLDSAVAAGSRREVILLDMPATLWLSARQHHDALLREFMLYQAARGREHPGVAAADAARAMISIPVVEAVDRAQAAGTAEPAGSADHPSALPWVPKRLDLRIAVPDDAGPMFAALQDVLDTAERLAAKGELLLRPALPEIIAVRDWACEQVISQLAGNLPSRWPGTDQERFENEFHDGAHPAAGEWVAAVVAQSTAGAIAADDANRILAISAPLAATLGWEPAELVGRRVITVVPPALREAHVAGFSRHLSTGESHVLGVPVDLPVLRRDGSELLCRFVIEHAALEHGRTVYVAWIDPVGEEASDDSTAGEG